MLTHVTERLQQLCDTIPGLVRQLGDEEMNHKPAPHKWSKKEILGHLTDSACNNHQRFVRGQFETTPHIMYDQDNWVAHSHYQQMSREHVLYFWEVYHRHLIEIIKHIPDSALQRTCLTNGPEPKTLQWLIEDYVKHQEYHLLQIVRFESEVTAYP